MRKLLFGVLLLGATGCQVWYNDVPSPDDLMHKISWFDHMLRTKAVHPYERVDVPRMTPPGTVPVGGGEADWATAPEMVSGPGVMMSVAFDTNYAKRLAHPTTPPGPGARSGQDLFETYCRPCHGDAGAGDGPVTRSGFAGVPSLLTDRAKGYADGYLYSMIRYGRGLMPRYGDKIVRPDERWAVVDYVRSLQAKVSGGGQ